MMRSFIFAQLDAMQTLGSLQASMVSLAAASLLVALFLLIHGPSLSGVDDHVS